MDYTVQYYDLVLLAIAGSVAAGAGVGVTTPVALGPAVGAGCLLALAVVGHGLFVRGPVDEVEALN